MKGKTMTVMSKVLSLEECFADFARCFPGRVNHGQRKQLAEFVGVCNEATVSRWLKNALLPTGTNKWKSMVFFHCIGYSVSEFEKLRPLYQNACKLLAFGLVEANELAHEFGYEGTGPKSRMFRTLDTNSEILVESKERLERYLESTSGLLVQAEKDFGVKYQDVMLCRQAPKTKAAPKVSATADPLPVAEPPGASMFLRPSLPTTAQKVRGNGSLRKMWVQHAAMQLAGLQPIIHWLTNEATPEERVEFRELLGSRTVFAISNDMDKLCTETANKEGGK